ncbi:D-alanyl-D-alanine carboxypeptidase/D-alanyl-D-alanine-endopeptidase [Streptomyces sp. ME18-1-4]|uniref:D-alanyl-D-alanine carboxypeptidase/D-alanyl-D-alanine endopeptidase n=1 Tax=Streptomyces sp. ME18-1-4 TaxID=3028685 RepID=UPI0029A76BA3|nr:D-alanyl-D-alanine carboxypeptidase/D-alanyl-D-alanine-endopeptidase [Streptomyces sp. ME18-1-4]MDX3248900.1 D-alanyl-D-alanine carboxypeptidase/D-alanyl-D-alanine-endopeptidase [Streptomyces sp. ME18-1-4]
MIVPELRPWRAARPHVVRVADAVRPRLARAAGIVRPRLARVGAAAKPQVARLTRAAKPHLARVTKPMTSGPNARSWQYTAGAATAGLALAAGVVTAAGPWDSTGQRTAERDRAAALERTGGADHGRPDDSSGTSDTAAGAPRPAPSAASVLTGLGGTVGSTVKSAPATLPTGPGLANVLAPLLDDPALGARHTAAVVDVATGRQLYGTGADQALTPASTTKIATAVAALSAMGAEHRLTTHAALEPDTKELVLVGGGDPTLTARSDAEGWASLRTLAVSTAAALKKRGLTQVTLSYDTTLYAGTQVHPIGVNPNLAPVTALSADEGRTDDSTSGPATRVSDPAADATRRFAEFLKAAGIRTTAPGPSKATTRAQGLATVSSPPLSALVERMLTNSDNDIAEALARQTAVATGVRADFDGAGKAVQAQLKKLGLPTAGARFRDGSGLNREDRLTANLLTALLVKAGDPARPNLRPVLTGLPVAGFTGTLTSRYGDGAAGVVRAKTGTLTGVNTLAGTVVDRDGRLLAFALLTADTTDPAAAQAALDRAATALAGCGCR